MFPEVYRALKDQRTQQAEDKLKAGPLYQDQGLIFANEVGKPFNAIGLRNRHYKPALERAGLPREPHFHAPRHIFATSLLRQGAGVEKVSVWLGHANPGFTYRVYYPQIPR